MCIGNKFLSRTFKRQKFKFLWIPKYQIFRYDSDTIWWASLMLGWKSVRSSKFVPTLLRAGHAEVCPSFMMSINIPWNVLQIIRMWRCRSFQTGFTMCLFHGHSDIEWKYNRLRIHKIKCCGQFFLSFLPTVCCIDLFSMTQNVATARSYLDR